MFKYCEHEHDTYVVCIFLSCIHLVTSTLCSSSCLCRVKNQGNDRYKRLEYKTAMGQYHRALLYLKAIDASQKNAADLMLGQGTALPLSPELRNDVDRLYADCQSNLAGNSCILIIIFSSKVILLLHYTTYKIYKAPHTHTHNRLTAFCPGQPG